MLFQPRQFPRVSLATEVRVQCGDEVFVARSQEIGAGGMALQDAGRLSVAQPVQLSFTLSPALALKLDAVVWWKRDHRVGIRFDPRDPKCRLIQQWVEEQIKLAKSPQV
ncbi:MAG: PilZ domain-containing protein [Terriglobales bacterium]